MTKRDVVKLALEGRAVPYTPWSFRFTAEVREALTEHYGSADLTAATGNHIVELGSDIGFFEALGNGRFRDTFGAVWDRRIDRDIGNVESPQLAAPTLKGYGFPDPGDSRFFADIPDKLARYGDEFLALLREEEEGTANTL